MRLLVVQDGREGVVEEGEQMTTIRFRCGHTTEIDDSDVRVEKDPRLCLDCSEMDADEQEWGDD